MDNENKEFSERLVTINRVAKVVKGGRRFGFAAIMIVQILKVQRKRLYTDFVCASMELRGKKVGSKLNGRENSSIN